METNFTQEQNYLRAKKKVKAIKGFYSHLLIFILVNIFISAVIIFGLMESDYTFAQALSNFGVYSTWLFWGIGIFFHWMGVFGFKSVLSQNWEERKIKEIMDKEDAKIKREI